MNKIKAAIQIIKHLLKNHTKLTLRCMFFETMVWVAIVGAFFAPVAILSGLLALGILSIWGLVHSVRELRKEVWSALVMISWNGEDNEPEISWDGEDED